jgi:hypothetical protein
MAPVRPDSARTRLRCSLKHAPAPRAFPTLIVWPFAWLEVTPETILSAGKLAPIGRPRWSVPREAITTIERTQNGLRFHAEDLPDPGGWHA